MFHGIRIFPVDSLVYSSTTSLPQRLIYLNKIVVEPEGSLIQAEMSNVDVNANRQRMRFPIAAH